MVGSGTRQNCNLGSALYALKSYMDFALTGSMEGELMQHVLNSNRPK